MKIHFLFWGMEKKSERFEKGLLEAGKKRNQPNQMARQCVPIVDGIILPSPFDVLVPIPWRRETDSSSCKYSKRK